MRILHATSRKSRKTHQVIHPVLTLGLLARVLFVIAFPATGASIVVRRRLVTRQGMLGRPEVPTGSPRRVLVSNEAKDGVDGHSILARDCEWGHATVYELVL